jgi:phenylacetate-CoA ligase
MNIRELGLSTITAISGDRFYKYYKELERNQWLKKDEIEQLQLMKLKRLLNYANENIVFYKERFRNFNVKNFQSLDELRQLPILTKEELKLAGETAITNKRARLVIKSTSGTTGPPFNFVVDRDFFSLEIARNLRIFDFTDISIGDPWVIFTPLRGKKSLIFSFLTNRLVLDANLITTERTPPCCPSSKDNQLKPDENMIRLFCARIKKHKPKAIYSYPSSLIALATFIRKWDIPGINIKIIISSGEVITSKVRTFIEETFSGEVFNLYGTTEFPAIAEECKEHNGLHIFTDSYVVEFLDDGAIVLTDLDNYTMPFIRYKTGDHGFIKNNQCNCSRYLPLMEITRGRVSDLIITPDGKFLRKSFFASVIEKNPEIENFQIIYEEQGKLLISLVVNKPLPELRQEYLIKRFKDYTDNSIDISVKIFLNQSDSGNRFKSDDI